MFLNEKEVFLEILQMSSDTIGHHQPQGEEHDLS